MFDELGLKVSLLRERDLEHHQLSRRTVYETFEQGRLKQGVGLAVQYVIFCESLDCGTRWRTFGSIP